MLPWRYTSNTSKTVVATPRTPQNNMKRKSPPTDATSTAKRGRVEKKDMAAKMRQLKLTFVECRPDKIWGIGMPSNTGIQKVVAALSRPEEKQSGLNLLGKAITEVVQHIQADDEAWATFTEHMDEEDHKTDTSPLVLERALDSIQIDVLSGVVSFSGGVFSQFFWIPMDYRGETFACNEAAMHWAKAMLFKDEDSSSKLLSLSLPPSTSVSRESIATDMIAFGKQCKKLGRKVKKFDEKIWKEHRYNIVRDINAAKFATESGMYLLKLVMLKFLGE
jgi:predicted NAD-dependent protein-ADP-ribosyltransferase YbiA (DUF1768 family)